MENKLKELTEKIYSEGIEKAKSDAVTIIKDAQKEAEDIIIKAKKSASEIISKAQENAVELRRNNESELRMASKQAISKLKQQIIDLIAARTINTPVQDTLKDKEFLGALIMKIAACFNNNVQLILPDADKAGLIDYFNNKTRAELTKGIDISFDGNIRSGFRISPKDDNYLISFTDEDFSNYFRGFMRTKTINLLFGEE